MISGPMDSIPLWAMFVAELAFGWVVLEAEQDPKKAPTLAYAKKGVAHLRAVFKESGLV